MSNKWKRLAQLGCILGCLGLTACMTVQHTYTQTGTKGYIVTCKGLLNSWESCLAKAGNICGPQGYDVSHKEEYDRILIVSCKTPH